MAVSFFAYGKVADAFPQKVNALKSMEQRLDVYKKTGNTEYLIDAANFLMIEFMRPSISGAEFSATDSDGSVGRTWNDGGVSRRANK